MKRAMEVALDINSRTLKTVLRAEQRTVGALLNCSGKHQGRIVLSAAMRRSGLEALARTLESPTPQQHSQPQETHQLASDMQQESESETGDHPEPSHGPQHNDTTQHVRVEDFRQLMES